MADDKHTVVTGGSSNLGLIVLALAIVVAAVIGFVVFQNSQDDPVSDAASAVGEAAQDVGDAAKK